MRVRAVRPAVWVNVRGEVAGRRNSSNPAAATAVNTGAATAPRATEIRDSNFDAVTFRNAGRLVGLLPMSRRLAFVHRKKKKTAERRRETL